MIYVEHGLALQNGDEICALDARESSSSPGVQDTEHDSSGDMFFKDDDVLRRQSFLTFESGDVCVW